MRLDEALVRRDLAPTRSRARALVLAGEVSVGGTIETRPGRRVGEETAIVIAGRIGRHVSLGAEKLLAALDQLGAEFDPKGRVALDIGASTGGFTHVLIERGAARIYAVDVGRGQLHETLLANPRVVAMEGLDCRSLTAAHVPEPVGLIVADVSFISLLKALRSALALAAPTARLIALVKPQFESDPAAVGKGGIVRDEAVRTAAVARVQQFLADNGWTVAGTVRFEPIERDKNVEFLIGARR